MKFRKKPVVIEAIQWNGDNEKELYEFMGKVTSVSKPPTDIEYNEEIPNSAILFLIHTLEGIMTAIIGDWIIKGVNGEFYPCKPDIFEKTYSPADESDQSLRDVLFKAQCELRALYNRMGIKNSNIMREIESILAQQEING